ncbi:hypothetical protein JW905_11945 [bacterium]|nr:hypothetical protein [candidate division CSSED10-310 bacterium]
MTERHDQPSLISDSALLPICAFLITLSFICFELNFLRIVTAVRMAFGLTSSFFFSAAILGLGTGSMVVVLRKDRIRLRVILPLIPVCMAFSYVAVYLLLKHEILLYTIGTWQHFLSYSFLFMPLISTPFILAGLAIAKLFTLAATSRRLLLGTWAADLLGSAVGGIIPILFLSLVSPLVISLLPLVLGLLPALLVIRQEPRRLRFTTACIVVLISLGIFYVSVWDDFNHGFISAISLFDKGEKRFETAELAGWSPYHRINYRHEGANIHLYYNSAPITYVLKHDENPPAIERVSWPFRYTGDRDATLIIGAGGGKEVRFAQELSHSRKVTAVELDPVVVELVCSLREHAPYIHNPGVRYIQGEGRHFLTTSTETYDHIVYALIDSPSTIAAQSMFKPENYIYTVESFRDAWARLADDGILTIYALVTYPPEPDAFSEMALKLYRNLAEATGEPEKIALYDFSDPQDRKRTGSVFLIYQKDGLNRFRLDRFADAGGRLSDNPAFQAAVRRVTPNHDSNPFIYIKRGLPLIMASFLGEILIFSIIVIGGLVLLAFRKYGKKLTMGSPLTFGYFFLTGFGFMLLEVVLIHKLVVSFGAPHLSSSVIITTLLVGMGVTSLGLGLRQSPKLLDRPLPAFLLLVAALALLPSYVTLLNSFLMNYSLPTRTAVTIVMLFPLGLLLGLPFPVGFNRMRRRSPESVVLAYAMDTLGSIVGTVSALTIPMVFGYPVVFAIIALDYVALVIVYRLLLTEPA